MQRYGLEFGPDSIISDPETPPDRPILHPESGIDFGYRVILDAFSGQQRNPRGLDGLLSIDDLLTTGALNALEQVGMQVPGDLRIATYANAGFPIRHRDEASLIRLEIDITAWVRSLFEELDTLMANENAPRRGIWIGATPRIPEALLRPNVTSLRSNESSHASVEPAKRAKPRDIVREKRKTAQSPAKRHG